LWYKLTGPSADPKDVLIITDDITRFWEAYDESIPENRFEAFQEHYIDPGSPGLQDFIPNRIVSAEALARTVEQNEEYYLSARENTLKAADYEPAIRASFFRLKELYPNAVFPDVYFVIGRMNAGGTTGRNALVIGTEMYGLSESFPKDSLSEWHRSVLSSPEGIPAIVAHELIHYQQPLAIFRNSLLYKSLREGSADFVAEMISGRHINGHVHEWASQKEDSLWAEFSARMNETDTSGWLYDGNNTEGVPADLGYWIGYKIVQSYYEKSPDKEAALAEILRMRDAQAFLDQSGYRSVDDSAK
jgi:hypothetical protein